MIDLYKKAIEKIQTELNGWNSDYPSDKDFQYLDLIENIIIDLEEKLKELGK